MKNAYRFLLILIFNLYYNSSFSQVLYHQDIFKGGVTVGGLSSGMGGELIDSINLQLPIGSSINNAFIFIYSIGKPQIDNIKINGSTIPFDTSDFIFKVSHDDDFYSPIKLYITDITEFISNNQANSYEIRVPGVLENANWGWFTPILYIEYENLSMSTINTALWVNDQNYTGSSFYNFNNLNPINPLHPVGFSIFNDRACSLTDGNIVKLNNLNIGTIGGSDLINSQVACGGTKGHFYYENYTLYGLDDDIPNNTMNGTDALADISTYLNTNSTNLELSLDHVDYPSQAIGAANVHLLFPFAYTSPCDTFTTTLTPDTTICYGETLQLQATGGGSAGSPTAYEWTALTDSAAIDDLSCTNCPNPVFSGDSSQVYTVRIWNTDSCSVVKPVRINVSHPENMDVSTFKSICSLSNGKIVVGNVPSKAIQLGAVNANGDTINPNSNTTFTGMKTGEYSVFYIDKFGCSVDTLVTVEPVISTVAQFNAFPKQGTAPIQVNLTNQSQNATDYSWWMNGAYQGNPFSGFFTDTSGVYDIELIAWKNDSICADTTSFTVIVFDSLVAQLPNVFTPNNDGTNDHFNVKVNIPVRYQLNMLNRWGNVVFENEGNLTKGTHDLWNGIAKNGEIVTDGTYFYQITFQLDRETVNCEISECEVSKEGFVQIITN